MTRINHEKIRLTLFAVGTGLILERALIESDGSNFIQAFPIFGQTDIAKFIAFDVYRDQLADRYVSITKKVEEFFMPGDEKGVLPIARAPIWFV